jgi:hypothetical protein
MKNLTVLLAAVAAFALPVAALADDASPTPAATAAKLCAQQRAAMGQSLFATTYGGKANAFGKCVSASNKTAAADVANAAQACKAERAKDPAAFTAKYGTNGKAGSNGAGKNAFGKCVSAAVKAATTGQAKRAASAAAACKSEQKADATAFGKKYGSFGKCVSALAKKK